MVYRGLYREFLEGPSWGATRWYIGDYIGNFFRALLTGLRDYVAGSINWGSMSWASL